MSFSFNATRLFRRDSLELVSIHIPKTAGTSFRNILKKVYGEDRVIRVDITLPSEKTPYSSCPEPPPILPKGTKVIHGHFRIVDVMKKYNIRSDVPIITWVRDPVERVISNYFYLQKILRDIIKEEQRSVNILSKMEKTLIEYARADINRNRMSKFLEGLNLEDLLFVGIQEYFSEDLDYLAEVLGWEGYEEYFHNASSEQKKPVSEELRREIQLLNDEDMKIYRKAMELREKRLKR
ncbi:MAG: hypothetical protein D6726_00495 [Nitrospirae bacterium]|nr:MAG: hypothetical protein D6726_00495 [Nitrospirota bacterium]